MQIDSKRRQSKCGANYKVTVMNHVSSAHCRRAKIVVCQENLCSVCRIRFYLELNPADNCDYFQFLVSPNRPVWFLILDGGRGGPWPTGAAYIRQCQSVWLTTVAACQWQTTQYEYQLRDHRYTYVPRCTQNTSQWQHATVISILRNNHSPHFPPVAEQHSTHCSKLQVRYVQTFPSPD